MDPRHLRIEGYFTREAEHSADSLRQVLLQAGLDGAWLRVTEVTASQNGDAALGLLCAEVTAFGSDQAVGDLTTLRALSEGGRTAFFLAFAGNEDRVAYEVYRDGARIGGWQGVRREYPAVVDPGAGDAESSAQRAFNAFFRGHTGLEFDALLGSDAAWPIMDHGTRPGTEAFFLGRRLKVPEGTSKLLDLFRFRDRGGAAEGDHMAFLAVDIAAATRVLKNAPAGTLAQVLGRLDEGAAYRIGPFTHAAKEVAAEAAAMPAEEPAANADPSVDLIELVAMGHTGGGTAGDTVEYFDQVFFPLLNLYDLEKVPPLWEEEVASLEQHGCLRAMAEVLPYAAPEGQLLDSFGDEEVKPLAPGHVSDGEYSGALFLVDRARLRVLLGNFDGASFMEKLEKFRSAWWRAGHRDEPVAHYLAWRQARDPLDREDIERFATTLAEIKAVVGLCDENRLEMAVVFYEA
ncbi:MAG: hypothetical protein HY906_19000 [Deltaproteobacteria bacterium]|nr:hypothetical protein [Deltaproteobacteria bacterium]